MLLREANAWTALLQLNGSIAGAAHAASTHDDGLEYDEARETAAQREASHIGALSNLAALADALTNETLKLRSLRKARYQVTSMALQEVMREHAVTVAVALGGGLAATRPSISRRRRRSSAPGSRTRGRNSRRRGRSCRP